jgi:Uma2 family endonuclease
MSVLVTDPLLEERLIAERQECDGDRFDEVWEGVYVMAPLPNIDHQEFQSDLIFIFRTALGWKHPAQITAGVNVSDRDEGWEHNYRGPDVVVYLPGNPAVNRGTHWVGGPDFLVEIISPHDQSRDKLKFYSKVGVREVLLIDRKPWRLEFYSSAGSPGELRPAGQSTVEHGEVLKSDVLPFSFRLAPGSIRPKIEVTLDDAFPTESTRRQWLI